MNTPPSLIGRAEVIDFPELEIKHVPARIDTGAKTSSVWASNIMEDGRALAFTLFDEGSPNHTGQRVKVTRFEKRVIASSNGMPEERYVVKLLMKLKSRKVRASFTLANRASQTYPVLIGRNVLRGKFIVDVKLGKPLKAAEAQRSQLLQSRLKKEKNL